MKICTLRSQIYYSYAAGPHKQHGSPRLAQSEYLLKIASRLVPDAWVECQTSGVDVIFERFNSR